MEHTTTADLLATLADHTSTPTTNTLSEWLATAMSGSTAHLTTTPGNTSTWCERTALRPIGERTAVRHCHGCASAVSFTLGVRYAQAYITELHSRARAGARTRNP